jgi:hypothetical protein
MTDSYGNMVNSDQCIASLPLLEDCKQSISGLFYVVSMNKIESTVTTAITFSTLTGTIWEDLNSNGQQDSGETIYSSITVSLLSITGETILSTTTDVTGSWTFTNIVQGTYTVKVNLPTGVILNNSVTVTADKEVVVVPTLVSTHGTIIGVVWVDFNKEGIRNSTKNGFVDCPVSLAYPNGTVITTTTTNTTGYYTFVVITGYYQVIVQNPNPSIFLFQGNEDAPDNKANASGVVGNLYVTPETYVPANVALVTKPGIKCVPTSSNDLVDTEGSFSVNTNCANFTS